MTTRRERLSKTNSGAGGTKASSLLATLTAPHERPRPTFADKLPADQRATLEEVRRQVQSGECDVPKKIIYDRFTEATGCKIGTTQFYRFLNAKG